MVAEGLGAVLVDIGVEHQHGVAAGGEMTAERRGHGGLAAAALAHESYAN
jgi:hypothetical protein